ncbi:hypothetical protein ACFQ73_16470 [Amycolatopsis japonica]|uniref:DUF7677 family protein n=1 Tax=Amycolatopsis japonica TaxID=208439 RepID=UPI00366A8B36
MGHRPVDVRASLRFFAFYLANGTIDVDLLDGFDYRPVLFQFGSSLEQVFAIYGNVLEIDEEGNVLKDRTPRSVSPYRTALRRPGAGTRIAPSAR